MSFKYLNPGFPGLLDVTGGTLVTDESLSRTGVAFWQKDDSQGMNFSSLPKEIYCKFDFFLYRCRSSCNIVTDGFFEVIALFWYDAEACNGLFIAVIIFLYWT